MDIRIAACLILHGLHGLSFFFFQSIHYNAKEPLNIPWSIKYPLKYPLKYPFKYPIEFPSKFPPKYQQNPIAPKSLQEMNSYHLQPPSSNLLAPTSQMTKIWHEIPFQISIKQKYYRKTVITWFYSIRIAKTLRIKLTQ